MGTGHVKSSSVPVRRLSSVLTDCPGVAAHRGVRPPWVSFRQGGRGALSKVGCRVLQGRLQAGTWRLMSCWANLDSFQQQASSRLARWPSIRGGSQTMTWIRLAVVKRRLLEGPTKDLPRAACRVAAGATAEAGWMGIRRLQPVTMCLYGVIYAVRSREADIS